MTFKWGVVVGGLGVAVIALIVAVIVLATDGSDNPSATTSNGPCLTKARNGADAEIELSGSGLDCTEAKEVQGKYDTAASRNETTGTGEVAAVDGWRCEWIPLVGYPTVISCRSEEGRHLEVVATAPYPKQEPTGARPAPAPRSSGRKITDPVIFQTPSMNIGCRMERTRVACDIIKFNWSPPPVSVDCEQPSAWGHTIVFKPGGAMFTCPDGPIVEPGPGTPILQYGKAVALGPFACESRESGLVCIAPDTGHGFLLSLQKLKLS